MQEVLKKGLGFFVEMEDPKNEEKVTPKSQPPIINKEATPQNNEVMELLNRTINNRKSAYTSLLETARKMEKVLPNEADRIKAAFALIAAEGRTAENVIQAIDVHLSDLEGEHLRFKQQSELQLQTQSKTLKDRIDSLNIQNTTIQNELNSLNKRIQEIQTTLANNNHEIQNSDQQIKELEIKISSIYNQFKLALEATKHDLTSKKSSLSMILS